MTRPFVLAAGGTGGHMVPAHVLAAELRARGHAVHLVTDARRDIEEETVTRLPSKAFDEFLKALDRPMPKAAKDLIEMEPDWI